MKNQFKNLRFVKIGGTILLSFLTLLACSYMLNNEISISGKVTNSLTGLKITGVNIDLQSAGKSILQTKTNSNGYYEFTNTKTGTYSIKASFKGFKDIIKTVNVVQGTPITVNFKLIPTVELDSNVVYEMEAPQLDKREYNKAVSPGYNMVNGNQSYGYAEEYEVIDWNTESYDVINENKFKEVMTEPVSTFSIDVDKASYSNIRRYINNHSMPPKDAVRIEEMINYFDYKYPEPTDGNPFSVNLEMANCPWNANHQLIMVGLKGETMSEESIPACNFVFLLDVSGSMNDPAKLPLVKQSLKLLIEKLRPQDKVAIVVYAGAAGLVLESTPGSNKTKITEAIERLQSGGSTAGGAGIVLAYKVAKENFIQNGNNRVILATDGDFNTGSSSDGEMTRLIEEKRKDGVFLTILGFGMGNYKDSKMESISNAGNGNYAYIDNILEAKKMFGQELWGTLYTIAKDVKIQIEFNPGKVKAYRLVGYENRLLNREDFNNDQKDAGEIGSGHTVTALYEIIPAGSDEKVNNVDNLEYQKTGVVKSDNIMTLKLRYKKPDEEVSKLIEKRLTEKDLVTRESSENFSFACAVAEFGMLLRDSEFKGTASYDEVLTIAKKSKGIDQYGYRDEFIRLVETSKLMSN